MDLVTTRSEPLGHIKTYLQMLYMAGVWIEKLSKKVQPFISDMYTFHNEKKSLSNYDV